MTRPSRKTFTSRLAVLKELRAGLQWGAHALALPTLGLWPKAQAGMPVMVFPGLATTDIAMYPMRWALSRLGHTAYAWELGFNTHPTEADMDALEQRVRSLAGQHGQPVGLVGWSLGGAVARALAARCPGQVRCVVALGAPLGRQVVSHLDGVYSWLSGRNTDNALQDRWLRAPLRGVPLSSIASVDDHLLAWQGSVVRSTKRQETILLTGVAHMGLPAHPMVLWLVHDRLLQSKKDWIPYRPDSAVEQWWLHKRR